MRKLLEISGLVARYHGIPVLEDVSMHILEGEIVALVGRNGVGKSTLLKSVLGLVSYRHGMIMYRGEDISRRKTMEIVRMGIGYVPQGRRIFRHLSVSENLEMVPIPRSELRTRMEQVLQLFPRLRERRDRYAGTLSGGEQQMLSIARSLLLNPSLLLMDEPTEGLDRRWTGEICLLIQTLRDRGKSILMVEHNLEVVTQLCDRVYVLYRGNLVCKGRPEPTESYREALLAHMGLRLSEDT